MNNILIFSLFLLIRRCSCAVSALFLYIDLLDIESILIRSLCGTDEYANNKRLYSKPGQTLIVFNPEYGREATYHIPLDGVRGSGGVSI